MNFDLLRLKNGIDKNIIVDEVYSFSTEELEGTGVSKLDNVEITGEITLNALKDVYISLEVNGVLIMPCAITLKPVEVPINIVIEGDLSEFQEDNEKNTRNFVNTLDILPIIWENILMEIPMRVIAPNASLENVEGEGWRVITGEEKNVNSELSKLKDLLQDSEVR